MKRHIYFTALLLVFLGHGDYRARPKYRLRLLRRKRNCSPAPNWTKCWAPLRFTPTP